MFDTGLFFSIKMRVPPLVNIPQKFWTSFRDPFLKNIFYSVTRLGDFLRFGQALKAGGNNYFTQMAHIVGQFL